jgi:hypothetical protein
VQDFDARVILAYGSDLVYELAALLDRASLLVNITIVVLAVFNVLVRYATDTRFDLDR